MKHIENGLFRINYSGHSKEIAERLMEITKRSYSMLKDTFRADHDLGLEIYWASSADWSNIPSCRHKANYYLEGWEVVTIFSSAAGHDLSQWFRTQWQIE